MSTRQKNILYRSDCKLALDKLYAEGIRADLIYLDPPFNSSRIYSMIFNHGGINAQEKAFHDMWSFDHQTHQLYLNFTSELEEAELPSAFKDFMKAWMRILQNGNTEDRKLLNYLMYMTERLIRMKRILKPEGSIYFHCDPTASHYIKIIMDGIFERKNFVNEIIWCYRTGGVSKKHWARKHDVILMYKKGLTYYFEAQKEKSYLTHKYGFKNIEVKEDDKGYYTNIYVRDYWNIDAIRGNMAQSMGYPTQKPIALLDRIVKASCPENGIVLDPFCGCGTTIEAAHNHKCTWIGIDISWNAINEIKKRMAKNGVSKDEYNTREGNPETMAEYNQMNPYEKQDWLIRQIRGFPNQRKSGDRGIDGDMKIHIGYDGKKDCFDKMIFSVKTGKQCKPEHIRELVGTMKQENAIMGGLILDVDPTPNMEIDAQKYGNIEYLFDKNAMPRYCNKVQILTAQEIIDGTKFDTPPTMQDIKSHREGKTLFND